MENVNAIEEVIEKARKTHKQKAGMLAYWSYIGKRYIINYANVSFLKKDRRETLKVLRDVQCSAGFMFWANSPEGDQFYREKYNKILAALKAQQIKPWIEYEYGVRKPESELS
jgi:hypothetical protein